MARQRYQSGSLFIRGKRRKVWVGRWRETVIGPDGTLASVRRSEVLGAVAHIPSRREARKLLESLLRPFNEGRHRPQSTITFGSFVAERFEPTALPTLKQSTRESYQVLLRKHLVPRFGKYQLREINRAEIQRFVLDKLQQGLSWESGNHLRNLLSKVLGTAASWGYLSENPARGVKMPEKTQKRPSRALTAEEVRRLLAVLKEPVHLLAFLAVMTGLRIGELLALRWGRIDLLAGTLSVKETCYRGRFGTPKTRASRRQVPLSPAVVRALLNYHQQSTETSSDALVFATRKGTPLNPGNLRKRNLRPACERAGLRPIDWHTLRHTHSTLLHLQGTPLKVAQAQLGHSRLATTLEVYTHAPLDAQREAVAKLEAQLDPNGPKFGIGENSPQGEVQRLQ